MKKFRLAFIGGTGLEALFSRVSKTRIGTPYGPSSALFTGRVGGEDIVFLPRHGEKHSYPPHKINYRANVYALHMLGVERVVATNAVGAINPNFKPGDLVVPSDLIDFTRNRPTTFYDTAPVTHIDLTEPYCPELRNVLVEAAKKTVSNMWTEAVFVCVEGPRYETPAEIRMFQILGGDIVGMTGVPELMLARELEICYASICFVSNKAAGMQKRLSTEEVVEASRKTVPILQKILKEVVPNIPENRNCPCMHALEGARI